MIEIKPEGCCKDGDAHDDKHSCSQGYSSFEERFHPAAAAAAAAAMSCFARRREEGGALGRNHVLVCLIGIEELKKRERESVVS